MTDDGFDYDADLWVDVTASSTEDVARAVVRDVHELEIDEPPFVPFGNDTAPCPGDYLMVATAGCQIEVLKHCFEKARVEDYEMRLHAERETAFPEPAPEPFPAHKGIRYTAIHMELTITTSPEFAGRVERCLEVCEDACIISRSVEAGIDFTLEKSLHVDEDFAAASEPSTS